MLKKKNLSGFYTVIFLYTNYSDVHQIRCSKTFCRKISFTTAVLRHNAISNVTCLTVTLLCTNCKTIFSFSLATRGRHSSEHHKINWAEFYAGCNSDLSLVIETNVIENILQQGREGCRIVCNDK